MKFTQRHAHVIAQKLEGKIIKETKHDQAVIYNDGQLVARYGIRRASKEVGHDHIPKQLGISPNQTSRLASCTLGKDWYFESRREQEKENDPPPRNEEQ